MTTPHVVSSFDYKVTDRRVRDAIKKRSLLDNTIQIGMPFVRATTTIQHAEYLNDNGNIGFSIGLHSIEEDTPYEDIYSSNTGDGITYPLVGYTFNAEGKPEKIYAKPPSSNATALNRLFDQGKDLYTSYDSSNFVRMPPPGITRMTIGRNKNGLLAVGELEISVPTLSQLEILHRTFLVPGMGMVLEWGQQYAQNPFGEFEENTIPKRYMFPWHDRRRLDGMLVRLARREVGIKEILEDYVYPTNGQYMWMFGRVANFSTKANTDGSFNCSVRVVGPSEDSWAYSTVVTVIPPADGSGKICLGSTNSIESYFKETANSPGLNLKTLLDGVISKTTLPGWDEHVIKITNGNKGEGNKTNDEVAKNPNVSTSNFGEYDDAYFITWRFFVNVVLNHPDHGILNIFRKAGLTTEELAKINTLRPYKEGNQILKDTKGGMYIDDPLEPYVGYNKYLRSSDPSTLIIYNDQAIREARASGLKEVFKRSQNTEPFFGGLFGGGENITVTGDFLATGTFGQRLPVTEGNLPPEITIGAPAGSPAPSDATTVRVRIPEEQRRRQTVPENQNPDLFETNGPGEDTDKGLLSSGIWINHRAIVESMVGADTLLRGVTNLLERMNAATTNYWKLTLDALEARDGEPFQYIVADANYRGNSAATTNLLRNIHVFNKYVRKLGDTLYGSDVIDCTVDLSLPKRLFAQIATLGLMRKEDLVRAGITNADEDTVRCKHSLISDPNDTLREMFSIVSIANNDQNSPDLTVRWGGQNTLQTEANGICRGANVTTAQADGEPLSRTNTNTSPTPTADEAQNNLERATENKQRLETITGGKCPTPSTRAATGIQLPDCPLNANPNSQDQTTREAICKCLPSTGIPAEFFTNITVANGGTEQLLTPVYEQFRALQENFRTWLAANSQRGFSDREQILATRTTRNAGGGSYHSVGMGVDIRSSYAGPTAWIDEQLRTRGTSLGTTTYRENGVQQGPFPLWRWNNWTVIDERSKRGEAHWHFQYTGPLPAEFLRQVSSQCGDSSNPARTVTTQTPEPDDSQYKDAGQVVWANELRPRLGTTGVGGQPIPQNDDFGVPIAISNPSDEYLTQVGRNYCNALYRAQDQERQETVNVRNADERQTSFARLLRKFNGLSVVFDFIEVFPELMVAQIRCDADGISSNAFGASPGALSLSADLLLPGINGFRVGELFWVDRIPTFYKAFGAFQILSIEDEITIDGWNTKLHSRFNYLGNAWKRSVFNLLQQAQNNNNKSVLPDLTQPTTQ